MRNPSDSISGTLLLSRSDVERLLTPDICIAAVEDAFRRHALGTAPTPGILGLHAQDGSFHLKAALLTVGQPFFAAKCNANFPRNGTLHALPTIQGIVVLCDAANGLPLAIMDSMALTALRTAAATAIAAKHLARDTCATALVCGCGGQAAAQIRALLRVRTPARLLVYDQDAHKAERFVATLADQLPVPLVAVTELGQAIGTSEIVITCTTARRFFVTREMVRPGTFIAAVGADSEDKQELEPSLVARAKLVTDLTDQCGAIGELHHALVAGIMERAAVHAELGEIVAKRKHGRASHDEITIFDSTGTALQDVAAAIAVYQRALEDGGFPRFSLGG